MLILIYLHIIAYIHKKCSIMPKKKLENKNTENKPIFSDILVCNDKNLRPFMEMFIQEPENIQHQGLGILLGALEVTDNSKDSSYIVNYLISVIKKEYFSKPKRGPIESLESALHKANLALSNLAEHSNISWLGKLNALIAVIEKNNLHLSQTGATAAFLLRENSLTAINEFPAQTEAAPHPLKTFTTVSSGRLKKGDKLIISTDSLFDIFSLEEIKKSALRFSNEDFIRFLKTALSNELERAVVLIMDLESHATALKEPAVTHDQEINAFSQDSFHKKNSPAAATAPEAQAIIEIKQEIQKTQSEFIDAKTGHIYIKESNALPQEQSTPDYLKIFSAKLLILFENITPIFDSLLHKSKNISLPQLPKPRLNTNAFRNYLRLFIQVAKELLKKIQLNLPSTLPSIFPSAEKIKRNINQMNYSQKRYAALILILIFIVPAIGLQIKNKINIKKAASVATEAPQVIIPLEQDKNVLRIDAPTTIYSGNNILKILNLNGKIFAVTAAEIIDLEKNKVFSIPQDFGAPLQAATMPDLNLLFILNKDHRILSFSPISTDFKNNNLSIASDAKITAIGTYLTYIYLIDSQNNQIYRYPRADGGFGDKINWLKDTIDLTAVNTLAMNENIFIANGKNINKLFKGKTQNFAIEQSATPIIATAIALGEQTGAIFILDTQNSRIVKFNADGQIITQYYHSEVKSATSIAINEEFKTIYFSDTANIKTIGLE